jgi:hypothetical protein
MAAGAAYLPAPPPPLDPARLAQLRAQDGRPRLPPPTLQAVLGGEQIQPGREQEALAIWQNLRGRAQAGDISASEDLTMLTLMLVQHPSLESQPLLSQALSESALDAAVLPRHKQEQTGRLCRRSVAAGNRQRALGLLGLMNPAPPELDADSEYRVSAAMIATLDRDGQRVLALLGAQKDAIPIVDSMDPMASVLRANAYEIVGNAAAAAQILRELPDPRMLSLVQGAFPALRLCAQSSQGYTAATTQEAAQRAGAAAGCLGTLVGGILALTGLIMVLAGGIPLLLDPNVEDLVPELITPAIGLVLLVVGVVVVVRARLKGKRAAWLRTNGLSLPARVVGARPTGTTINDVPQYAFALQVAGPHGPYDASFTRVVPEHQVAMLLGREVRVRANPGQLSEVVLED